MLEELNELHTIASSLLGSHLSQWAESLAAQSLENTTAGHDDNKALSVLHALLSVRTALSPLVGNQQDTSHG